MSEYKPESDADETLLRQEPNSEKTGTKDDSSGSSDVGHKGDQQSAATIIRQPAPESTPQSTSLQDIPNDDATILRDDPDLGYSESSSSNSSPESSPSSATILRDGSASDSSGATILRDPNSAQKVEGPRASILSDPASSSQATILRSGDEMRSSPPDAATILREGGGDEEDDDRTIINIPDDDDATVIGGMGGEADTTYIASVGPQKSRGNSEAGRLLKNRFVLEEKVGSGGMGDVYKALDLRQQEAQERNPYIAIKILNESFSRHKDAFISLQRETTRTRGIPHPNIMAVYDFDKEGDTVFMSMELLDGQPLDDYLKDHPEGVSVEDAWNILDGICQGIGRAHGAGIVHSDFKPGNIYYTTDKNCKVFDFGIARAVSSPGDLEADGEKTVFDAGSLGALTPTYASYEMLKGLEPTKSDDVYAVALVAYELFTGKHPYNRVPADKALERGIEPEPIPFMKRRHWKALRKALEIKGENRTETIGEFYEGMFSEDPPYFRYSAIAALLVVSIGFGVYQQFFKAAVVLPEGFTQYMTSYESAKSNIRSRLLTAEFSSANWRDAVDKSLSQMTLANIEMTSEFGEYLDEDWEDVYVKDISEYQEDVLESYLKRIRELRANADSEVSDPSNKEQVESAVATLGFATELMEIVKTKYNFDLVAISQTDGELGQAKTLRDFQLETIINKEIADAEAEAARVAAAEAAAQAAEDERLRNEEYDASLAAFRDILRCKGDIVDEKIYGADGLEGIITNLKQVYPARFAVDKPGIVAALNGCITQRFAVRAPERARTIKAAVTTYLPGETLLTNIDISDLDPCAKRGLAGQGSRNRSWCEDPLAVGGTGPELVVIPGRTGAAKTDPLFEPYALSRVEIRIGDYNDFCEDTGCQRLQGPSALPATNISLDQAEAYAAWLSDQSGQEYRIPTVDEWLHAATTNGTAEVDENVNCTVDSRGVRLGEKLLNTLSGRPNSWGLYNHVGNAREWAVSGDEVVALGGAHTDPKAECTMSKRAAHSGQADPVTGFRIYRRIESSDSLGV
jgi:serine/threonine protein kinase